MMRRQSVLFICLCSCSFFILLSSLFAQTLSYNEGYDYHAYQEKRGRDYRYKKYLKEGLQYLEDNEQQKAIDTFWKAIYILPNEPDGYINLAVVHMNQGNLELALRFLMKAKERLTYGYPKKDILFYNLGLCTFGRGEYEKAMSHFSRALKANSRFTEAAYALDLTYKRLGKHRRFLIPEKPKETVKHLPEIKIIQTPPKKEPSQKTDKDVILEREKYAPRHGKRGRILQNKRRKNILREEAERLPSITYKAPRRSAVSRKPYKPVPRPKKRTLMKPKKVVKLPSHFDYIYPTQKTTTPSGKKLPRDYTLARARLEEGSKAFENKDIGKAISLLKQSIRLDPQYAEAYYRLGVIYVQRGKYGNALSYFNKALKINPAFTKAYINRGSVYGQLRKYSHALANYNRALTLEKDNPKIYYNIGMVYLKTGQEREAEEYFRRAQLLSHEVKDAGLLQEIEKVIQ